MKIRSTDLASHTVTRARGKEAFEALAERLRVSTEEVEIELPAGQPLSLSFLDEIVFSLKGSGHLARVTFVVEEPEALRKLGNVASMRHVDVWYRGLGASFRTTVERAPLSPNGEATEGER